MDGVCGQCISKNCFVCEVKYEVRVEVNTSTIPSTKLCEGFCIFCAVSFPVVPPFHEWSANEARFHECAGPAAMLVDINFVQTQHKTLSALYTLPSTLPFVLDATVSGAGPACVSGAGPACLERGPLACLERGPLACLERGPLACLERGPLACLERGPLACLERARLRANSFSAGDCTFCQWVQVSL